MSYTERSMYSYFGKIYCLSVQTGNFQSEVTGELFITNVVTWLHVHEQRGCVLL